MLPEAKLPFIGSHAWFAHPLRTSCKWHELRGRLSDRRFRRWQGGRFRSCSQNICTLCKCFVNKNKSAPCCRRRVGPFIQAHAWCACPPRTSWHLQSLSL